MKYVRKFEDVSSAVNALNLVSPNLTLIQEGNQLLNIDCGLDKPVLIKSEGGKVIIEEKPTTETWYFNNPINQSNTEKIWYVDFINNNTNYNSIKWFCEALLVCLRYDETCVTDDGHWRALDEIYRTIILSEPATGDLLTFLQANATKQ